VWKYVEDTADYDTVYPGDYFYYDGNRVIEHHKHQVVEDPPWPPAMKTMASDTGNDPDVTDNSASPDGAATIRIDGIYDKLKEAQLDKESRLAYGPPPPPPEQEEVEQVLEREFVYGLDYIDEHVLQYNRDGARQYILQDANYNVVGLTQSSGSLMRQMEYHPYGRMKSIESGSGVVKPTAITPFDFQGRWRDPETGLIYFRSRYYDPVTARMISPDPNGTGLLLSSALAMNAQTQTVFISLALTSQYDDGINLYLFAGGNPITGTDPSGLFSYLELAGSQGVQGDLFSLYLDVSASTVDAMKGIVLLANERNAIMANLLGTQSSPFDLSGIDEALKIYDQFQAAQMAMFGGIVTGKVIGVGKKLWMRYVARAGGRSRLLEFLGAGLR
jgi:RHS repeat-associated protein